MNRTAGCVEIATVKDAQQTERSLMVSVRESSAKFIRQLNRSQTKDGKEKLYAKRFKKEKGRRPYPGHELHHLYPKTFEDAFAAMGIDCHASYNLMELPKLVSKESYGQIRAKRMEGKSDDDLRGFIRKKTLNGNDGYNLHQELFHIKIAGDWNNQWKQFFIERGLWGNDKPDIRAIERIYHKNLPQLAQIAADAEELLQELIEEMQQGIEDIDLEDFRGGARY